MSKDGGGYGSTSRSSKSIHDVHISTLLVIDTELKRLHETLARGDGDDDETQHQIAVLIEELKRLSFVLTAAEVQCATNG